MTTIRSLRSWPRSSISSKRSIIGSDFIPPSATCRRLSLKPRFHHQYFLNFLCHFRGALQTVVFASTLGGTEAVPSMIFIRPAFKRPRQTISLPALYRDPHERQHPIVGCL